MKESEYLEATIQSLESTLAIAKAGLRNAVEREKSCKYFDTPATFNREQVKQGLLDLCELDVFDKEDDEREVQLLTRALELAPEATKKAFMTAINKMPREDQLAIKQQFELDKFLEKLRPDVAKDVRAVISNRGKIFIQSESDHGKPSSP